MLSLICGFMAALTCTRSQHRFPQFSRFGYASILLFIQGVLIFVAAQKCSKSTQNIHTLLNQQYHKSLFLGFINKSHRMSSTALSKNPFWSETFIIKFFWKEKNIQNYQYLHQLQQGQLFSLQNFENYRLVSSIGIWSHLSLDHFSFIYFQFETLFTDIETQK